MRKKFTITAKVYDKRGILLATAENNYKKSHPMMKYFAEKAGIPEKEFLHAEVRALLRCRDRIPYRIVVERYNADGSMALAKPCKACQEAIRAFGVEKVCYTAVVGFVEVLTKEL